MSRAQGRETFEGPSEQELENYIKNGRQSIKRMEDGKPPLYLILRGLGNTQVSVGTVIQSLPLPAATLHKSKLCDFDMASILYRLNLGHPSIRIYNELSNPC